MIDSIGAIDLFCGLGGLSLGLKRAGIDVLSGIDVDNRCEKYYRELVGAPFLQQDIRDVSSNAIASIFQDHRFRVLLACAPCQPFSGYSTRTQSRDLRWDLLTDVARIIRESRPDVVSVENVDRLQHMEVWQNFLSHLAKAGYSTSWKVLDCADYGVPQHRNRLVMLASRFGQIELPPVRTRNAFVSVRQAIGHLDAIPNGATNPTDPMHVARSLTAVNLSRIKHSRPAGTWRDWPNELRVACHTRTTGRTYPSVYGRMAWEAPSPTITTQFYGYGNGRFGHPDQDRALSLREGLLLQTFPETLQMISKDGQPNFNLVGRLIGNAVPPALGQAIGETIANHLSIVTRK